MKSKTLLVSLITLMISCKAVKDKRNCFESTNDKTVLNIKTFNDLKNYIKIEDNELKDVLWIIDGIPIEDSLIKSTIKKRDFDLLEAKYLNAETISFCKPSAKVVLILTNDCLNKYK